MSLGYPATKTDLDNRAGQLAIQLRDTFTAIRRFKAYLDTQTDPNLTGLGYSAGEVATLRSSYVDLDKLATVYGGTVTQGTTYDFQTFAKLLCGVI